MPALRVDPVRTLAASDIAAAMALKGAAGWNQTARDWEILLALAPESCFGIECDGKLAATTTAIRYGRDLAWIGMVVTDPAHRRRGLARRLLEHALQYLDERGVGCVKLDATAMGRGLYEQLGFREECVVERWLRVAGPIPPKRKVTAFEPDTDLDRQAFGADRSMLLEKLAPLGAWSAAGGFAMGRDGTQAAYFGPCVSRSPGAARDLLSAFLERRAGQPVYWDILASNPAAFDLARECGFARRRELLRMVRASALTQDVSLVFAIAGFEFG
jgi:GNAT superfamily N-acetyltransferase